MKTWLPLFGFGLLILTLVLGLKRNPAQIPPAIIGEAMPVFSLPSLYESEQSVTHETLGGQAYVLNVFGSWCVGCHVEHPFLLALADDVPLIGLNWRDDPATARKWLEENDNPYTIIISDIESDLAINLGVTGAPETYLVGADSVILHKYVGILSPDVWKSEFEPLLHKAVEES